MGDIMARSTTQNANPFAAVLFTDTNLTATADQNIRSGATTLYQVKIDNSANSSIVYLQLFDNASPTVGTTAPNMVLPCPASTSKTYVIDLSNGYPFVTALSLACTTLPTGAVSPASAVIVSLLCS